MFRVFVSLISLAIILQVNSLDVPRLYVLQDLMKFSSQIKDTIKNTDFRDPSLTADNNPITEIAATIDQISVESNALDYPDRSIDEAIAYLTSVYETFLTYAADLNSFNDDTINEFIEIVTVEAPDHVSGYLEVLESDGVWEKILGQPQEAPESCSANFTQQMNMYLLYEQIMVIKLKTLVSFYGAYNFKNSNPSSDSADDSDQVEEIFVTASQKYMQQLKEILTNANREVYICDSGTHVPDQDYVEFDGLFSAVVINQYEVGRKPQCASTCSETQSSGIRRCLEDEYGIKMCPSHSCQGTIYNCEWIGGDVDICATNNSSRKRYEWVRSYGNDARYGQWTSCNGGRYYEYRSVYYLFNACSTCFCKCSEELPTSKAIRTISLLPQMSNIDDNKVMSSVRFVLQDDMIHIQIAEAPLLPLGEIDSSQSSWVPLGNFTYVTNETSASFTLNDGTNLKENVDFAFVNFNERTLFMDQITAGPEYVVTGVKFSSAMTNEGSEPSSRAIQLEINVTPFDLTTGQLNPTDENPSQWITAETQPNPPEIYSSERREVTYGKKTYKYDPVVMHTTEVMPNKYLVFDSSSVHSDGGQSTVPFFDARPVDSKNSLALNGLGLVYRRAEDFAGLIALELFIIDISLLLDPSTN